ncbi:hypothetical protein T09_12221, partial [Trichinella sp. T9]
MNKICRISKFFSQMLCHCSTSYLQFNCIHPKKKGKIDEENIIFENLYPAMIAETGHLVGRSINNYSVGREQVSKTQV